MKFLRRLFVLAIMATLLWCGGLIWFTSRVGSYAAMPRKAQVEAIVVLTGGRMRFEEGFALLKAGYAQHMFVSGAGHGVTVRDLFMAASSECTAEDMVAMAQIEVGHEALDTRGNAQEVAQWTAERHITSLLIVTSGYHMPRSLLYLHEALPKDTRIVPFAVLSDQVKLEAWWSHPGTRDLMLAEYHKYLGALLQLGLWRVGS